VHIRLNQRPIFIRLVCRCVRSKNPHSQFDKFNHVKYTKSLSLRNWYTRIRLLFFAPHAPNEHKGAFKTRFSPAPCSDFCASRAPYFAIFFRLIFSSSRARAGTDFVSRNRVFRA
jgi:hypothetical protein